MLAICKYFIRILSKIFSASPSKDIKTFFIKTLMLSLGLRGHTFKTSLSWGGSGGGLIDFKMFGMRGRGEFL